MSLPPEGRNDGLKVILQLKKDLRLTVMGNLSLQIIKHHDKSMGTSLFPEGIKGPLNTVIPRRRV